MAAETYLAQAIQQNRSIRQATFDDKRTRALAIQKREPDWTPLQIGRAIGASSRTVKRWLEEG